ncbi:uncharacterized protein LOC103575231 [Microplitis demolitor]|uniref:uncharacterized protein LOC103575231 n=1 Tax=Microplitis demolitor TaxID=69319 RepID=UPI0004CD9392|nr:uncharacterized protein LOC103575231 [Microplitis demolitor]
MAILDNIRPLLVAARIFGCAPHRVTDRKLIITKMGLVYSIFVGTIIGCICIFDFYINVYHKVEFKLRLLIFVRSCLYYICILTDGVISMIYNGFLNVTVSRIYTFDYAIKFREKINNKMINACHLVVFIVVMYWTVVGYFTYMCEKSDFIFNAVAYSVVNVTMSMQIMKFIGMLLLLYQRFDHLDNVILQINNPRGLSIIVYPERGIMNLQEIWWLHYLLVTAAEEVNRVYSTQLFFWITISFLNGLSRIYTLTTMQAEQQLYFVIRDSFSVTACAVNLLIISALSHFTAAKANNIARSTFAPHPSMRRKKNLDNIEVIAYFYLKKLHFSAAAGLIRVDLPLLLSIVGAITTYLVILHAMNP